MPPMRDAGRMLLYGAAGVAVTLAVFAVYGFENQYAHADAVSYTLSQPPLLPPSHPSWHLFSEEPPARSAEALQVMRNLSYSNTAIMDIEPGFFENGPDSLPGRYIIFGQGSAPDASSTQSTIRLPENHFFSLASMSVEGASDLSSRGFIVLPDRPVDLHMPPYDYAAAGSIHYGTASGIRATSDASGLPELAGIDHATASRYNATGSGITVAIVDTGVDFSNPDIQDSLARDADTGLPLMIDPDGQGLVITNHTFYAAIDRDGTLKNYTGRSIPAGHDSVVYATSSGVFLDIAKGGKGTVIPVYNSLYPAAGAAPVFDGILEHDMKIGDNGRDYIRSQSGSYRLGAIFQMGSPGPGYPFPGVQVVPVLVVDAAVPGVYDTIIPDMSTSWLDYTREPGAIPAYDFDFTDENPIVLGGGDEFLVYDSDGDGMTDYTAGTAGARVLDVYAVINSTLTSYNVDHIGAVNGTLLPGMDADGRFFGVMTDAVGHGTASAATIVSAGEMTYDIYNNTKGGYTITGVAPGAKILPVKALWLGDAVYGWLWAAGFDNHNASWTFSGSPRADIITNSWGVSTFPNLGAAPGQDMLSLILDVLATPRSLDDDYPGTVMVSSAGNSGHGYGTLATPGAASLGMSVGASTSNVFVGYGPFKDQPRFGNTTTHNGHVVDFSSRGPGIIGDVRPDLVGIGAYGFVPGSMMGATQDANVSDPFTLFGGTSMAGPAAAGAAAVLMAEMTENLMDYDPFVVRNILMSTARDMYNDPFVQGAGLVDAGSALDFVHGNDGVFVVYNDDSYRNVRGILQPAIESANITDSGIAGYSFGLPERDMPITPWFAGRLQPGDRTTATFTVTNPGPDGIEVDVLPLEMSLVRQTTYGDTTIPRQQDPLLDGAEEDIFVPNYVRLADVRPDASLADLFDDNLPFPKEASLLVLNVNFEFTDFMNTTADAIYADDMRIASLYLYDWIDHNGDLTVSSSELSLVSRGGSWGTVQEIRVSDPASRFEGVPVVGIYPVPARYSYWTGLTGDNATAIDYEITASYYARDRWDAVWPAWDTVAVSPGDTAEVDITLVVPADAGAGIYQGFVTFEGANHTANVPVSFVVELPVNGDVREVLFGDGLADPNAAHTVQGDGVNGVLYGNEHTKGAFDMVQRYMAGDWRHYHFDVDDPSIASSASVEISWQSKSTSMSAFAVDPAGRIIGTNVPSGVFGHFLGWPSTDWLGATPFSEGGGFYPVSGDPAKGTLTFMTLPINGTGTYTIMIHTTLFGGESVTEPLNVLVRFHEGESGDAAGIPLLRSGAVMPPSGLEPAAASDAGGAAPDMGAVTDQTGSIDGMRGAGYVVVDDDDDDDYRPQPDGLPPASERATGDDANVLAQSDTVQPESPLGLDSASVPDRTVNDDSIDAADRIPSSPAVATYDTQSPRNDLLNLDDSVFGTGVVIGMAIGMATCVAIFVILKSGRTDDLSVTADAQMRYGSA